ncbi:MAG: D-alanyl-D-alanine carboxypeptidase/D-alanyl-D-alanine-endopeptidase [Phycisphaerales bacterium]|nr:D-alanyl-D-alanine carboxypeptidase/D-alanyl-D-alanine-endopeptidase [Planctomycetota bacterium]MBL6997580.1 D-alanyl-D-alanine carboxypeptidase/D-alanyl-D-alanine-endopeptidase [Phycisphaerales bacterium]
MTLPRFAIILILSIVQIALGDLQGEAEKIVATTDLKKGTASVCVIDTATGKTIIEINEDMSMIPASNQKLLTTAAALHLLGPSFTFQTKLLKDGDNLIVVGDGDPTFGDTSLLGITDWSKERSILEAQLKPWAQAAKNAGITSVETLYIDDRIFDQTFTHPSWPADQIDRWYCAQVAGINYHLNVIHFYPEPLRGTHASLGKYAPAMPWITIQNKTTSKTGKKYSSSFWVSRSPDTNKMSARGNVNAVHTEPIKIPFHDPSMIFGNTLATALRAHGISVKTVKRVEADAPSSSGKVLYIHKTPIEQALQRSNRDSHNLYAEALLKRLSAYATGTPGSFDTGSAAVKAVVIQRLGAEQQGLFPADGSGMSRDNKVSVKTLARLLESFRVDELQGKALVASLATPGNGTLRSRFKKIKLEGATVHAKSGYLREVCSLSGYIIFDNGRAPLVFSIIANGVKGTVKEAKKMQERIVFASWVEVLKN